MLTILSAASVRIEFDEVIKYAVNLASISKTPTTSDINITFF
jgi:hypothetical protein